MPLTLYNTLTRHADVFTPLRPGEVGLYTCGPTVYGPPHLGNLRTYLFEDILKRVLLMDGYRVKHVMNITDVGHLTSDADEGEDKMEKGAARDGKTVWEIAEFYAEMFKQNLVALNVLPPDIWCKATDHIQEQLDLIQKLAVKGLTYDTASAVYFDTSKFPAYSDFARQKLSDKSVGSRGEVVVDSDKKQPADFVLWFKRVGRYQNHTMHWPSPWGDGFPGWHIECSAMSMKYLGETFDIHCGGVDHIPVHHPNEIAQSEGATGKPFVHYWLHGEFLVERDQKVAKSAGAIITLDWLQAQGVSPLAYRYFCLQTHYRKQLNFSLAAVTAAQTGLQNLYDKLATLGKPSTVTNDYLSRFRSALNDDLNAPQALAVAWDVLKGTLPDASKKATLLEMDKVLGLELDRVKPLIIPSEVQLLVADRETARQTKDFVTADKIRTAISQRGFTVDDTDLGPVVKQLRS